MVWGRCHDEEGGGAAADVGRSKGVAAGKVEGKKEEGAGGGGADRLLTLDEKVVARRVDGSAGLHLGEASKYLSAPSIPRGPLRSPPSTDKLQEAARAVQTLSKKRSDPKSKSGKKEKHKHMHMHMHMMHNKEKQPRPTGHQTKKSKEFELPRLQWGHKGRDPFALELLLHSFEHTIKIRLFPLELDSYSGGLANSGRPTSAQGKEFPSPGKTP
ncbi:hypothetical protein HU200_001333 [Digitaria exilis]|uniref:Uncharacterized protein n=1 Tax=Digitaria exilis TaxID=1010633 RepID=A0A835FXI1_9POAL|nr:hypothetical protein HU200_001333 [Digitaria exilis]